MMEIMWAIKNPDHGLYYGTWPTRGEAIREHTIKLHGPGVDINKCWRHQRDKGDRAVQVLIQEYDPVAKETVG